MIHWNTRRLIQSLMLGLLAVSLAAGVMSCSKSHGDLCESCDRNSDCGEGLKCTQSVDSGLQACTPEDPAEPFSCPGFPAMQQ
jgi:hypothetical protein